MIAERPMAARRDLFEVDNARALSPQEVAKTFVSTQTFWRLLSPKNHIVVGARGSGKTALAKMLSHEHLRLLDDERARSIIDTKSLVGIYIPTRLEWVGALRNKPWNNEQEHEEFFSWRLNVASALAFLRTVRSCLDAYFQRIPDRANCEAEIVQRLVDTWLPTAESGRKINSLPELQRLLKRVEFVRQRNYAMARTRGKSVLEMPEGELGIEFSADLFSPMQYGASVLAELIGMPDEGRFMVVIDEAEFLTKPEQRILNSFFRTHGGSSVFKMTTMPYKHLTMATNTGEDLRDPDDFEYLYVDQDPVVDVGNDDDRSYKNRTEDFARLVFKRRAETSGSKYFDLTLDGLLGSSVLLDPEPADWSEDGKLFQLMLEYCDEDTKFRATSALRTVKAMPTSNERDRAFAAFSDSIGRKLRGALLLREAVANQKGAAKLDVYSGVSMVVRCSDGNPRTLVRIYNAMLRRGGWQKKRSGRALLSERQQISARQQTEILIGVSDLALLKTKAAREVGIELHQLIDAIGNSFRKMLHEDKLSTDIYLSIEFSEREFTKYETLIKAAVSYGLFYVSRDENKEALPNSYGRFRLAYVLSPHYRLLPRKGRHRSIERILPPQSRLSF